jgi:O-glycosyl hydrolase
VAPAIPPSSTNPEITPQFGASTPDSAASPEPAKRPLLHRSRDLRQPAVLFGVLSVAVVLSIFLHHSLAATATNIAINGASTGQTFDGVGAISGGGGNSRYVNDYPAVQQAQMMNYLFKPDYGAALQILKVEIGGDTNSTDGAESSIEHTAGTVNCNAGYEWQMMQQAKALNPNIKLYGLAWGAPGWISGHTFNSPDTITYLVNWLSCAKQKGLTIDYIGGQNEKAYSDTWYENLRTAMNNAGFTSTQIVAADQAPGANVWNVANDIAASPQLKSAIGIVGNHDVCDYPTDGLQCSSTSTAQGLGLPLWISEAGHMDGNGGAADIARTINRGYPDAKLTGYLMWPMMDAMPPGLSHEDYGLLTADEPWSGNYSINNQVWAFAHTTQFTAPGWQYVDSGTGYFGGNRTNGSYVTYKSPNNADWSMVAETSTSTTSQDFTATISGGLNATGPVHVWATNFNSSSPSAWFQQLADVTPSNGTFSYTLQPGYLYTFTTTTGQSKAAALAIPAAATLKLPYSDTFATMDPSNEAKYFAAMQGAFEGQPCLGGVSGTCLEQMTPVDPIEWGTGPVYPYTLIGDNSWSNYTVQTSSLFTSSGSSAGVIGRFEDQAGNASYFNGYLFQATDSGAWTIYKNNNGGSPAVLKSGTVAALGTNKWHTLALSMQGSTLTASIDGKTVGSATDSSYTYGPAGLDTGAFTNTWPVVQFRNFSVTGTNTAGLTGSIYSGVVNYCLDDYQGSSANNNKIDLYSCNYSGAQNFNLPSDGTIRIAGKCLDLYQQGKANGTKVELFTCNGGANQQWVATNGTLVNPVSGKCLDDPGSTTTNGTQLDIYTCDGALGQYWMLPH